MKNYKTALLLLLICSIFCSCEDFFSSTLEIDPPVHTDRLAVHAFGSTHDNLLKVSVDETVPLLEEAWTAQSISGAEVLLFKEDALIYQLDPTSSTSDGYNYIMPDGVHVFEKGATYRLEVTADSFPIAMSETRVPFDVTPISVTFDAQTNSGFEGDELSGVNILFQDNESESNYYEFSALRQSSNQFFYAINSDCIDNAVLYGIEYLISEDASYNGNEKNIEVLINEIDSTQANDWLYLSWRITSRGHYLFNKTAAIQRDSEGNPFSSPVQVFSNFEDGIGIFSIVNESIVKVE